MVDPFSVSAIARTFSDPTDGQARKSLELVLMLLECSPAPFSRDHFTPGHITCTGLVLAPDGARILLVHHRRLDRWLLPGGHVEPEDAAIGDAARREVIEETGVALRSNPTAPLCGVDVHGIPRTAASRITCITTCSFFFGRRPTHFKFLPSRTPSRGALRPSSTAAACPETFAAPVSA
jgi:8-oxo-dGTP pyrophosphatase MutT (NUDIX family)